MPRYKTILSSFIILFMIQSILLVLQFIAQPHQIDYLILSNVLISVGGIVATVIYRHGQNLNHYFNVLLVIATLYIYNLFISIILMINH